MRKYIIIIIGVLVFAGCMLHEKRDTCPLPSGPDIEVVFPDGNLVDIAKDLRLYVFDAETGVLVKELKASPEEIAKGLVDVELEDGKYTVVAWGTSSDDFADAGYTVVAEEGLTTIDDFVMELNSPDDFGDLFHGISTGVTVTDGNVSMSPVSLIRHTHLLRVNIAGVGNLTRTRADMPVEVFVRARKTIYNADGTMMPETEEQNFGPVNETLNGDVMTSDIRLQRLLVDDTGSPAMLYVRRKGKDIMPPMNIVEYLLKPGTGYTGQNDLDVAATFNVDITYNDDLTITVSINEWGVEHISLVTP